MSGPTREQLVAAYDAGLDANTLIDCSPGDSTRYRVICTPIPTGVLVSHDDGSGHWHGVEWGGTVGDIGRVVECLSRSPWTQQILRAMLDGWRDGQIEVVA